MKKTLVKNSLTNLLICLAIAVFSQCTFEPDQEFNASIKAPEPIDVTIIIHDPGFKDPYYLLQPTRFEFKLEELNNAILSSEVKLNGKLLDSNIVGGAVTFLLDPYQMEEKEHFIEMVFYADTKSGSLANIVGAEYYVIEQSFRLIIDSTPPEFHSFKVGLENGFLTMRWVGPQDQNNFVYKLWRSNPSTWFSSDTTLYDTKMNHFVDPGYVGGDMTYILKGMGFDFNINIATDDFRNSPADFTLIKDDEENVKLVWTKSEINTENVILSISAPFSFEGEKSYPFTSAGEIPIGKLGFMEGAFVNAYLHRTGYSSQKSGQSLFLDPTPALKQFEEFIMLKNNNKLLIRNDEKVYRYNLEGYVLEDSISLFDLEISDVLSFIATPDESKAYISDRAGNLVSFDPLNFSLHQYHDLTSVVSILNEPNSNLATLTLGNATDDGLITANFWKGKMYLMLIDLDNGMGLWHSPPGNYYAPTISNDGKYLAVDIGVPYMDYQGWVLKNLQGEYQTIGKIDRGDHYFLPGGEQVISVTRRNEIRENPEDNYIKVYNLTDPPLNSSNYFSDLKEFLMPYKAEVFRIGYDPVSNYVWFTNSGSIELFNPTSMKIEKSFNGNSFFYANNYYLNRSGFILKAQ